MNLTEKGSLEFGVEYPAGTGDLHYDFEIRLSTVGDNIAAYERPEILGGGVANMRVNAAVIASCLVSIGTIPKESITPDLINTMVDTDYDVLSAAQDTLKKKRRRSSPAAETIASPKSTSDSTGLAQNDSAS